MIDSRKDTFKWIDEDHSGQISVDELRHAFKNSGRMESFDKVMKEVDFDGDGEVSYSEFQTATLPKEIFTEENLRVAFNHFDTEEEGVLTRKSIEKTFLRASRSYSEDDIKQMVNEIGLQEDDSELTFEKVCALMKNSA